DRLQLLPGGGDLVVGGEVVGVDDGVDDEGVAWHAGESSRQALDFSVGCRSWTFDSPTSSSSGTTPSRPSWRRTWGGSTPGSTTRAGSFPMRPTRRSPSTAGWGS